MIDIAKTNGKKITPSQRKEISEILDRVHMGHDPSLNPCDMFRPEHVVKTLILLTSW